jgi:hypothetical protein
VKIDEIDKMQQNYSNLNQKKILKFPLVFGEKKTQKIEKNSPVTYICGTRY